MPLVFDFLNKYFDWILIILHDINVIDKYNTTLQIEESKGGNIIFYT